MKEKEGLEKVSQLYSVGIVISLVAISLLFISVNTNSLPIVTNFLTNNNLASQANTVFAPASHTFWNIQIKYLADVLVVFSLVVPIWFLYLFYNNQQKKLKSFNKWLELDWAISGTLMVIIISMLSGVEDLMALVLIAGLTLIGYKAIQFSKKLYLEKNISSNKIYIWGLVSAILPWLLITVYAKDTIIYGMIRSSWYVYVLYLVGIINLLFLSFSYKLIKNKLSYLLNDRNQVLANAFIKVLFLLVLIIGLKR